MNRRPKFGSNHERGSAILEFGLVAIVLLALFFGAVDFGRALYTYHFVANAAREATRWASVRGAKSVSPAQNTDIAAYIGTIIPSGINATNVVMNSDNSFIWPGNGPGSDPNNNGGCPTSPPISNSPGCLVRVQISYPFVFIFPLMPTSTCQVGQGNNQITANICITSTSQMVISQ
jgi:Flp pilus assembly protein TadG